MSVFEEVSKKVTNTAKAAAKKSSELVEVTKLNMSISSEKDKIKKIYGEIGLAVYTAYTKGEEVGGELKEQCELITACEANIAEMKQKILELKSMKACPNCGLEIDEDHAFCFKCGAKL